MKAVSLREQKVEELRQTHTDTRRKMFDLRVKKSIGDTSEQPLLMRNLRRELARIKTVMHERGLKE